MSTPPTPTPLGLVPSFGFGDRLGLATPGHLGAMRNAGPIRGVYAQQSIREMTRTRRTPDAVMQAAVAALDAAGYTAPWGADADHLKTPDDVIATVAAGFTFFTIDPSDHVDPEAGSYDLHKLEAKHTELRETCDWVDRYHAPLEAPGIEPIELDRVSLQRASVKYGRAVRHTIELARVIEEACRAAGRDYEIELSVDETPAPTTPGEHYIIADQLRQAGVKIVSLAPRYVGDFEKGIDYKGALAEFEASLAVHAAIALELGPYKLSLHSGSDKLSIYPSFARITRGAFHVKTAGTSYLEAVRVAARHDAGLFRNIVDFSRGRFETDRATYHISAELGNVVAPAAIADDEALERLYLDEDDGRQILHVTFGSVLCDAKLGPALRDVLNTHPDTHEAVLTSHLGKHIAALCAGM